MTREIRIYIAGPLFSVAEREFNKRLAEALKAGVDHSIISLPQKFASTISGQPGFLERVFEYSLESIRKSDAVVAILDGPDVDAGTCVEIGYAYANKKPIIGIRTDFIRRQRCKFNGIKGMYSSNMVAKQYHRIGGCTQ